MLDALWEAVLADFGVASKIGRLEVGAFDGFSRTVRHPEQDHCAQPMQTSEMCGRASTLMSVHHGTTPSSPIGDNSAASRAACSAAACGPGPRGRADERACIARGDGNQPG